ncbi:DUF1287 domain-containing protein, partial [Myxococcota bacterium]|nr:DUF1287 domain-containing protein [Myxococcota bacterium]
MITYFLHHFKLLDRGFSAATRHTYRPGDIVFMDTLPKAGPDHVGIVADTRGTDGNPLIINNWTTGCVTARMALLSTVPVTHHFRITSP